MVKQGPESTKSLLRQAFRLLDCHFDSGGCWHVGRAAESEPGVKWYRGYRLGEQEEIPRDVATRWVGMWGVKKVAAPLENCTRRCSYHGHCFAAEPPETYTYCECFFGYEVAPQALVVALQRVACIALEWRIGVLPVMLCGIFHCPTFGRDRIRHISCDL
jgi:hypothetical protein